MTRAIVFDLWNTLAYNRASKSPLVRLKKALGVRSRDLEEGLMLEWFERRETAFTNLCEHLGIEPEPSLVKKLVGIWNPEDTELYLFPDVLPALKRLKPKYKLGLISNTDCFSVSGFFEKGHDKWFDVVLFSFEKGLLKPDPKIFQLMLKNLGTKPAETLMVGDNLKDDIRGAERIGMQAILIKRRSKFQSSHLERGSYSRMIGNLDELEQYLD